MPLTLAGPDLRERALEAQRLGLELHPVLEVLERLQRQIEEVPRPARRVEYREPAQPLEAHELRARTPAMSVDRRVSTCLPCSRPSWIALAMTSGVVAGDAVGGELLGDGERVEHRRQPTTRPARARPAPAARSIWADFEAKAHGRNGRFVAERPVNTGPTPLTDPRLSDPPPGAAP